MSYTYTTTAGTVHPYTINTGAGVGGLTGTITISNGGTSSYSTLATPFTNSNGKAVMTMPAGEDKVILEKTATLDVKGNLVINGLDLEERLKTIEKVLGIPERDVTMEAKYPSLKKKFDEYINTLEKYRTFERIKGEEE